MASLGTSFSTQGATPFGNAPKNPANPLAMKPTTPVANALNLAVKPTVNPSIKSQKITETTYHPPENGKTASTTSGMLSGGVTGGLTEANVRQNLASYNAQNPIQTPNVPEKSPEEKEAEVKQQAYNNSPEGKLTNSGTYGGLIGKGVQSLEEAGKVQGEAGLLRQAMQRETRDVMGNPYYSGSVKVGQAANIAQQQGSQLEGLSAQEKALTTQGQAYLSGAGAVAPIQAPFTNQLIDPTTGKSIQTGGGTTPFGAGVITGNINAGQEYAKMNVANVAAKGIKNTITSYLQKNPTLNPSDLAFSNSISQWATGQQLGDPKYQTLANYLNEYISTLAPILGVGGDTTNLKTEIAQSMINAKASGQSITEVLNNLEQLAEDKVKNIQSAGTGGGVVSTTPTTGSAGGNLFGTFF